MAGGGGGGRWRGTPFGNVKDERKYMECLKSFAVACLNGVSL